MLTAKKMNVKINNEERQVNQNCTLAQLMSELYNDQINGKAIAVDNRVVPAAQWAMHKLKENDNVLIITATQGG